MHGIEIPSVLSQIHSLLIPCGPWIFPPHAGFLLWQSPLCVAPQSKPVSPNLDHSMTNLLRHASPVDPQEISVAAQLPLEVLRVPQTWLPVERLRQSYLMHY